MRVFCKLHRVAANRGIQEVLSTEIEDRGREYRFSTCEAAIDVVELPVEPTQFPQLHGHRHVRLVRHAAAELSLAPSRPPAVGERYLRFVAVSIE